MKNKCYNVTVNIARESEDIIADAFTCTGWTKCQVSWKMHVGTIGRFALHWMILIEEK